MYQYVPDDFKGRVVLHQHNCEYLMWHRFGEIEKNIFKKAALYIQSFLIKRYETKIGKQADVILAAPNDIEELVKLGIPKEKFFITYHLAEDDFLSYPPLEYSPHKEALLFFGTLTWEANIDGLIWFLDNCWEKLLLSKPNLQFYIVGKNPDKRIVDCTKKHQHITLPGFVEDLEPYFQKSGIFICPLRFGSGIKVKVVNAMYRGIPVVTTPIGIEGLSVENNKQIAFASNPQDFNKAILKLLNEEKHWSSISQNSRSFAKEHLSWEFVFLTLDNAINS
jgi:glycosyltransferase involved in cell wall biosynthesis